MAHAAQPRVTSLTQQHRRNRNNETLATLAMFGLGLMVAAVGYRMGGFYFPIAGTVLAVGAVAILCKPILGIYLTVLFALIGDAPTASWYPFGLNFSSRESILFLHDALTFTPIELYLGATTVAWLAGLAGSRQARIEGRPVVWAVAVFGTMLMAGLFYGVFLRGGNLTIAIWESRPMFYLPVMFVLVTNLFTRTAHYTYLAIVAACALLVHELIAIGHYWSLDGVERADLESLTEHAASVHYNWVFLLLLGLLLFHGTSRWARMLLALLAIPTGYVMLLSQRRAGIVALALGFMVFSLVLLYRRRAAFFALVPAVLIVTGGYTAAFWNSTSGVGFGAQAIKTVVAPSEVNEHDASSNVYRIIENYNLVYTLRTEPATGVGFGRPFLQPIRLPDISFFVFYEYIPHNSVLWVWLKTGYLGFVSLLVMIALTLRAGLRAALTVPSGNQLAITVAALGYVAMYFVFAYVDIAWDARSTLFLASCMAACANMARLSTAERDPQAEAEHSNLRRQVARRHPLAGVPR
ncbi:MAG TPA: O-antigen ligase family protein [Ilumatobacter sp.]|nr:O-antigen ligase family protein [Ilumatobacter sp.]